VELLKKNIEYSLEKTDPDKINFIHLIVHPGQFTGKVGRLYAKFEAFLTEYINPLVKQGQIKWATFSEKVKLYEQREKQHH